MQPDLVSTGKAAQLCCVTPDSILKWVKNGKIQAVRTAGGHHRISLQALRPYLGKAGRTSGRKPDAAATGSRQACWEFHGGAGGVDRRCLQCIVYTSRAEKCFVLARMGKRAGHPRVRCTNNCARCKYYQSVVGTAARVLVVTEDRKACVGPDLDVEDGRMKIHFASCGYEVSTAVQTFSPEFIILDSSIPEAELGGIYRHLRDDPRAAGSRFVLAANGKGASGWLREKIHGTMRLPISRASLETCIRRVREECP